MADKLNVTNTSILYYLFWTAVTIAESSKVYDADVLILGGGAAGIAAGKTLSDAGVTSFLIVEGSDRIGGRVRSAKFGGVTVELGANWVYDHPVNVDEKSFVELIKSYKLDGKMTDWDNWVIYSENGTDLTKEADVRSEDLSAAESIAFKAAYQVVAEERSGGDMSIRSALRLSGWYPKTPLDDVIEYLDFDFELAATPQVTSLKDMTVLNCSNELFITDQRGFVSFLETMTSDYLEINDPRLIFNTIVTKIAWSENDVTVTCKHGRTFSAPYAILTFSLGVLQNNAVEFSPELPIRKSHEIHKFQIGLYTKIFLQFPSTFWDKQEILLYAHQVRGFYPVWQNLNVEGAFPGKHILMVTVTDEESRRLERETDESVQREVMTVLRRIYGDEIPEPVNFLMTRWSRDPLFYGAYSNRPVEASETTMRILQENVGRLYFGGEATHAQWHGFLQGALDSGRREAEKVSSHLKFVDPKLSHDDLKVDHHDDVRCHGNVYTKLHDNRCIE
ncbi:uncharacterized protein LOC144448614 [Glandiceps talaboti]